MAARKPKPKPKFPEKLYLTEEGTDIGEDYVRAFPKEKDLIDFEMDEYGEVVITIATYGLLGTRRVKQVTKLEEIK